MIGDFLFASLFIWVALICWYGEKRWAKPEFTVHQGKTRLGIDK